MKKWLVGCLITGLLLLIVGGGALYWFVWRPLSAAGGDIMGQVNDMAKIGEAEQSVKNQEPFTAAADGKLTPLQVTAFVSVQQAVLDKLGPEFTAMEEKYKKMAESKSQGSQDGNLKDVMGAYADLTSLMAKAKQAQVEVLNSKNMSLEEYRWIRDRAYEAMPLIAMDTPATTTPDAQAAPADNTGTNQDAQAEAAINDAVAKAKDAAAEAMKQNIPGGEDFGNIMQGADTEQARANAELLRPHKELIMKTMAATWMGL
jgi:hypothetical protein